MKIKNIQPVMPVHVEFDVEQGPDTMTFYVDLRNSKVYWPEWADPYKHIVLGKEEWESVEKAILAELTKPQDIQVAAPALPRAVLESAQKVSQESRIKTEEMVKEARLNAFRDD